MSDGRRPSAESRDPAIVRRAGGTPRPVHVAAALAAGLAVTTWVDAARFPDLPISLVSAATLASLLGCVLLTLVGVFVRWFRWHFLVRRFTAELLTRDSLVAYLATLPACVTPFYVGELLRIPLLRKRFASAAAHLVPIWFIERVLDGGVLLCALLAVVAPWAGALGALVLAAVVWTFFRRTLEGRPSRTATVLAVALTIVAWSLPIVALWLTLGVLAINVDAAAVVHLFSRATLLGGVAGSPLAGGAMSEGLAGAGVPAPESIGVLLVQRAGTSWFAVILGCASILLFRERLGRLARGVREAHFDDIAAEYEEEIPVHVRDRLLGKKVGIIVDTLAAHGIPGSSHGLDLGCGQGWYLAELCVRGYAVDGTDYSTGQLVNARSHLDARTRQRVLLVHADARALPFADASYDFVYGINAVHHLVSEDAQRRALREIVRVLRPGGVFLLHEINTINPLFRWYMGYLFPLLKQIDEGNERWVLPDALPDVPGARWTSDVRYFTFLPDFVPAPVLRAFAPLEAALERSPFRRFSAHYQACLVKDGRQ